MQIRLGLVFSSLMISVLAGSMPVVEECRKGSIVKQSTLRAGKDIVAVATHQCTTANFQPLAVQFATANVEKCDKSIDACAISCNSTLPQPVEADCDALVVALNHVQNDTFTAPPLTFTKFSLRTCSFTYTNFDRVSPYDVCMVQFTMQALTSDLVCRASSSDAVLTGKCTAPGGTNNTWLVEVTQT